MSLSSKILLTIGLSGLLIIFVAEWHFNKVDWYTVPDLSFLSLIRTAVIAFLVFAILKSFISDLKAEQIFCSPAEKIKVITSLVIFTLIIALLLIFPNVSVRIAKEDNIIEWLSFFCLFIGFLVFLLALIGTFHKTKVSFIIQLLLICFVVFYFVLAMEEISWGQRVFNIATPAGVFEGNTQHETNLHNFYTEYFETAYYGGFCFLFVFLPFIAFNFPGFYPQKYSDLVVPSIYLIVPASLSCSLNFLRWNLLFTQIWFFIAIFVLLIIAFSGRKNNIRNYLFTTIFLVIVTQGIFLLFDNNDIIMHRGTINEYKELYTEFVFLLYSVDIYVKLNKGFISDNK